MIAMTDTGSDFVSLKAYHVIQWLFFALCLLAFAGRTYVRYVCFHRLLVEDWLMLLALACHLGLAIMGQLFLANIYEVTAAEHGAPIGPNFFTSGLHALKAFGVLSVLSVIGIWLIKLNFLLFFYRLGNQIAVYRVVWWIVFIFSIGCGAGCLGLFQYPCMFGSLETVFVQCSTFSVIRETYVRVVMTAVLDIVSDVTILAFPIYILWKVKITLRKKLLLSAVFGMVGFTIAVTIVRGSIFGGVYKSINESGENQVNITWITFWFLVEFTVAYIIACIVSFRTLFVHNEQQSEARDAGRKRQESEERRRQGLMERMRRLHDSILDTCRTWEGHWDDSSLSLLRTFRLPKPPSGRLSVDFSRDTGVSSSQRVSKELSNEFQA
ncbi:hypothetical protein J7T55_001690 [Diaporthe amygdali]|uniref:uncharacterized protein n=1 Tax=Phomopsis amygdali TaxID=1214568 RepID=UPI0022FE347E|nr:uncharacterized protein J7T55_001690 [Diaporthe amygdali]KAJ0104203.1 hypothetical protein J7T55_001690 [Diaporthe amygdali]